MATDKVKVHYRGTFPDGKEFDSSYKTGQPAEFPLDGVIKCWTEGVQKMKVGGKAKLTCPASIAYGERGAGGVIPPNEREVSQSRWPLRGRPSYMLRRYCPPTSNSEFVICPSEQHRTARINTSNTLSLAITAC